MSYRLGAVLGVAGIAAYKVFTWVVPDKPFEDKREINPDVQASKAHQKQRQVLYGLGLIGAVIGGQYTKDRVAKVALATFAGHACFRMFGASFLYSDIIPDRSNCGSGIGSRRDNALLCFLNRRPPPKLT